MQRLQHKVRKHKSIQNINAVNFEMHKSDELYKCPEKQKYIKRLKGVQVEQERLKKAVNVKQKMHIIAKEVVK